MQGVTPCIPLHDYEGAGKIYWETPLLADKMVKFNNPNIVIWNSTEQKSHLIDAPVPQNYSVVSATANKITKYKDLKIEIQKFWN